MARERRGLGDVFHYFISEAEQAQLRERTAATPRLERSSPPPRWCVPVDPARPLAGALVVDLAAALARLGPPVAILAPSPPAPFVPRAAGVEWRAVEESDADLVRALAALPPDRGALVALPCARAARALATLPRGALRGVIVPVDGGPRGLGHSLALLRKLASVASGLVLGAVLVGADASAEADVAFRRLRGAAERQLGVSLVALGALPRDAATVRSLLRGVAVIDLDEEAASARSLRALGERLARPGSAAEPRP
jgi:hypothetical protein